jgi:Do/DeqQ family serine protease
MSTRKLLLVFVAAMVGGIIALFAYTTFVDNEVKIVKQEVNPAALTTFTGLEGKAVPVDLTVAAEKTVHAVVHVKTESRVSRTYRNPLYEFFYGHPYQSEPEPVVGFGSGVIVSPDGYIITNNHVIKNSENISVTLNDNREFDAQLVGTDPSTDLAVIKISDEDLPFVPFGNSNNLKLGEWVLAVGNPFNLTSTVTAGIVSAKGRNLGILQDQYRIESFIQTDAALNPGNSGGALVNTRGELVGINTAIISPSGGYAGNSFAVPVSIAQKTVEDLIQYGEVQRAFLGVSIQDVDAELADELGYDKIQGVYISGTSEDGAAREVGMKEGDVIVSINDVTVSSTAELLEQISRYRPGDKVEVEVIRNDKRKQFNVVLRNKQGDTKLVKREEISSILGAKFSEISAEDKNRLGIRNGLQIIELEPGKLKSAGIEKGFIITQINNKAVDTIDDIKRILSNAKGGVYIEGVYQNGVIAYYAFGM